MSTQNTFMSALQDIGTTTVTENGDKTYSSSLDRCVDLFFQVGAIRGQDPKRSQELFASAFGEEPELALSIALWARDIRGGAGERQTFKNILSWLETYHPDTLLKILPKIPEVGRWDDLFHIMNTDKSAFAVLGLYGMAIQDRHGLACKWAPREARNKLLAARIRNYLKLSPKQYRQLVHEGTTVVEQQMCAREWDQINYSHVPSVASARYSKAFKKHDEARYNEYLENVKKGAAKINTQALYPYDVLKSSVDDKVADVLWNNLPDYVPEGFSFMPIVDVSGSMNGHRVSASVSAMDVAISLGLYLAERNKSVFKDSFITFSAKPAIITIPKTDVKSKFNLVRRANWDMNTNLDAVMQLILHIAVKNNVPQKDLPNALLILSDMEFDAACGHHGGSVVDRTRQMFLEAGYEIPNLVWWNIASRNGSTPVRAGEKGMALVSGFSPALVKNLLGGDFNPRNIMLRTVNIPRYMVSK